MNYSVVVRTLGNAGEKYAALLKSIEEQTVAPSEVVVVLADGYQPSPYHIANERIVYTRKGMVNQRQVGFEEARSPYLLVVDDDVELEYDFVEKAMRKMSVSSADAIFPAGSLTWGGGKFNLINLRNLLLGNRRYSNKRSDFFLSVGRTGGTVVNSKMESGRDYCCQTANFQCFFITKVAALGVHFEDEIWLEDTGYAWPDDRVFFYKAFLKGYRTLYVPEIRYRHLDAKSGAHKVDKMYRDFYTHERNITIFWYRFLYSQKKSFIEKLLLSICFVYRCFAHSVFYLVKCIVRRKPAFIFKLHKGYADAIRYLKVI